MQEYTPLVKSQKCSVYDTVSFGRDGFKPILHSTQLIPFEGNLPAKKIEEAMPQWLPIMKQWYFNNHKMLNGVLVISNQEDYIGVGENIVLDANLFSQSFHVKGDSTRGENIKVLAHVESVSNYFTVNSDGAKNFTTTITFVRGVFTDANCKKLFKTKSFGIDSDAKDIIEPDDMLNNVFRKERETEND